VARARADHAVSLHVMSITNQAVGYHYIHQPAVYLPRHRASSAFG